MKLGWKIAAILGLALLMLAVLGMVRSLVSERQQRAVEVRREIAQFSAGEQSLRGPFLVLPFTETVASYKEKETEKGKIGEWAVETTPRLALLAPEQFDANGQLAVEILKRGIFEAPIYRSHWRLRGRFAAPERSRYERAAASSHERISYHWGEPYLTLGMSDVRGIQQLGGQLAGQTLPFAPGAQVAGLGGGVHAPVQLAKAPATLDFQLELQLSGSTQLLLEPVGKESRVTLTGNWPHPSFAGNFAPLERSVTAQGFSARWQTSHLATGAADSVRSACSAQGNDSCSSAAQLGLRLIDPVDRYVLSERTLKYANLFLLLIFGAVFLMEVLKRVAVHPVQYGLVGMALALFFLLTLSLSEHLGFTGAYWLAAGASVSLLGYYVSYVLAGWRRGLGFACTLAALYGLLFGILQSEDMALLMGSLTLFGLLALVMILTRRLDWYSIKPPVRYPPAGGAAGPADEANLQARG